MKSRQWILLLSTSSILGACVAVDPPRPVIVDPYYASSYMSDSGLDMGTPVYVAAYPDYVFYHRYDPRCDCIRIVRLVEFGGTRYWVDHTGRRIHEGYWEPTRPSAHALHDYRDWSRQHRTEFHRAQAPGRIEPQQPAPHSHHVTPPTPAPAPTVTPSAPQSLVGPDSKRIKERHRDGENGAGTWKKPPAAKPDAAKPEDKASAQDTKHHRRDTPTGKDVLPKPAPAIKPTPAPAAKPGEKPGEKKGNKGDHERHHSEKPEGTQK